MLELHDEILIEANAVAELVRKQIIELLESKLCWCVGQPLSEDNGKEELMKHMNCDWQAMQIEYHVALIKREHNG